MAKKTTKSKSKKYSFINEVQENLLKVTQVTKTGALKLKRSDVKSILETAFLNGVKTAASGERVRFPILGALVRRDVAARKAGKGVNPFTGEEIMIKARPASKKPRFSIARAVKETFADKRNW
jgi:DNA-binding protein HU-beta